MLNVLMEFRKGILFVRLTGIFSDSDIDKFNKDVKEVILESGIRYVVFNVKDLEDISKEGIKMIKNLRKIINKDNGEFFLIANEIKELRKLANLEYELNVFEKVVI